MFLFNKFLANDRDLSPIFEPISKIEKFSFPLFRDITFVKVSVIFFWKLPKINMDVGTLETLCCPSTAPGVLRQCWYNGPTACSWGSVGTKRAAPFFLAGLLLLLARAFSASGFWLLATAFCLLPSCFLLSSWLLFLFLFTRLVYLASGRDGGGWRLAAVPVGFDWLAGWDVARMSRAWCHMFPARQPGRE